MSEPGRHSLLPYRSTAEFLDGAVPFLRDGVRAEEAVLVITDASGSRRIQEGLGADAPRVEYADARTWYSHPVRTTDACLSFIRERNRTGRPVRILGEPTWQGCPPMERIEWERVEALTNIICAETDARVVCAYDQRRAGPEILQNAMLTHPEIITTAGRRASPGYVDPWDFTAACDEPPLPPRPESAICVPVPNTDLHVLRAFVAEEARLHGLPDDAIYRLVSAITEVATNAVRHGAPPILLRLWVEPGPEHGTEEGAAEEGAAEGQGLLVCEVTDTGVWRPPEGLGFFPPQPPARRDFGLWAVRLLCSAVQVRAGLSGTTVRLHLPAATHR